MKREAARVFSAALHRARTAWRRTRARISISWILRKRKRSGYLPGPLLLFPPPLDGARHLSAKLNPSATAWASTKNWACAASWKASSSSHWRNSRLWNTSLNYLALVCAAIVESASRAAIKSLNFGVEADFVFRRFDGAHDAVLGRDAQIVENVALWAALVLLAEQIQVVHRVSFSLKIL